MLALCADMGAEDWNTQEVGRLKPLKLQGLRVEELGVLGFRGGEELRVYMGQLAVCVLFRAVLWRL